MRSLIIIVSVSALLFCGCIDKTIKQTKEPDFIGTEIIMPGTFISKIFDTLVDRQDLLDSENKIVVYFDSTGCNSCKVKELVFWKTSVLSDTLLNDVSVVVILFPTNERESEISLMQLHFDYPVFFDLDGDFERNNPDLPKDSKFHTFLLDRQNRVVLAGNPVQNPQLWERYKTEIKKLIDEH